VKSALLKLLALFCLTAAASAAGSWSALRAGMNVTEVQHLVGPPVLATAGHGYIHWCFDAEGDAIFYGGSLVFWTAPQNVAEAAALVGASAPAPAPAPHKVEAVRGNRPGLATGSGGDGRSTGVYRPAAARQDFSLP
jgi:hypothetical protein